MAALCLLVLLACPAAAERLLLDAQTLWQEWSFPSGALVLEEGRLHPVRLRKHIDAAPRAHVRGAGSHFASAALAIDGDPATAWSPDAAAPVEDWWIEIDLGQILPVQQVRLRFAPESPPLAFFNVSISKGERFINSANVVVEGTLLYSRSQRFAFNQEHLIEIDLGDELVRVVRLEASRRPEGLPALAEIEIDAFGDNIALHLIDRGGSVDVQAAIVTVAGTPSVMFDGDLVTAWRVSPLAKGSTGGSQTFGDYRIDLGATYWIDTLWLLGEPLGIPPRSRQVYANFLSYQLLYSDGSLAPDGSLAWQELASVPPDNRNLFDRRNFRHDITPVAARYVRLFYPTSQGGQIIGGSIDGTGARYDGLGLVSEFQVYGQGHPERVQLRSPVIDLGQVRNITGLDWEAEVRPGARLLFRSRSGDEVVEEKHYYDKNGKEVTAARWEKLIASFRGPVETVLQPGAGWSPWSEAYSAPDAAFRSPSPRRYLQLEAELRADDPLSRAALDQVEVHFFPPLARSALGEVQPRSIEPGVETEFTYFLRSGIERGDLGFDGLALSSSVPIRFLSARLDGAELPGAAQSAEDGFRLALPGPVGASALLEVRFAATVFHNNTRFRAFLERDGGRVRQQVDPGDAVPAREGAGDAVAVPVDAQLLSRLQLGSPLFTPNGDGVNDVLALSFDALKLLDPRPIRVHLYNLGGGLVRTLLDGEGLAGHYALEWDGRDQSGRLAPPGLYLLRLEISGDSATRTLTRVVGLNY